MEVNITTPQKQFLEERTLLKMMAWIQYCGEIGHSANFQVHVDGDGASQYTFEFKNHEDQMMFKMYKDEVAEYYKEVGNVGIFYL